MSQPYLSQIELFSFSFAPRGFAFCDGRLLPINQNQALFALLGTMYGGNGTTTFALPNLQGRVPVGWGSGAGLSPNNLGEVGGSDTVTLALSEMPAHTHVIDRSGLTVTEKCLSTAGNQLTPVGNVPAVDVLGGNALYSSATPNANMNAAALAVGGTVAAANAGGGQPHDNHQPYLVMNYCIALVGIFPSRN